MKTYINIIAKNLLTKELRLLRKIEIDTNKIKAGLTPKQKARFDRIVERLGLKGKELSDAQEEAILYLALEHNGEFVDRDGDERLMDDYKSCKRIERRDIKGVSLLFEILEVLRKLKLEKLKSRLFDFIVWLVILHDWILHDIGGGWGDKGFGYASIEEMITTYAQVLGVSTNAISNTIDGLKRREAIIECRRCITLDFPFSCFGIEENQELQKELKGDEIIETAEGVCFIPQPFVTRFDC